MKADCECHAARRRRVHVPFLAPSVMHSALPPPRPRRACPSSCGHAAVLQQICSQLLLADDYLFILVLIGDSGVGKSCLLLRFAVRFLPA